jgi:hypothetical protein
MYLISFEQVILVTIDYIGSCDLRVWSINHSSSISTCTHVNKYYKIRTLVWSIRITYSSPQRWLSRPYPVTRYEACVLRTVLHNVDCQGLTPSHLTLLSCGELKNLSIWFHLYWWTLLDPRKPFKQNYVFAPFLHSIYNLLWLWVFVLFVSLISRLPRPSTPFSSLVPY